MKRLAWAVAVAAFFGAGAAIGNSMSTEAMGVVVGVVLGVAAAIPMALLVVLVTQRGDPKQEQPPVVIVDRRTIPHESQTYPTETYFAGGKWREIPPQRIDAPQSPVADSRL